MTINAIKKPSLKKIEERVKHLPLLPSVLSELIHLDQDSIDFYDNATRLAKNDPPLAARLLRVTNSASSAPSNPITNIQDAMIRIGAGRVLSLITAVTVARVFTPTKPEHKLIWQHSIETANMAHFIARKMPDMKVDKELAYTCGLLHDIGRFVMFEIAAEAFEETQHANWGSPVELPLVEKEMLGFTHAEVGHIAAKKWQLPKVIEQLIHYHHRYDICRFEKVPTGFKNLMLVIQLADFLSVLVEKHPEWKDWDLDALQAEIRKQCIHADWPEIDFPILEIAKALPTICEDCNAMLSELGID